MQQLFQSESCQALHTACSEKSNMACINAMFKVDTIALMKEDYARLLQAAVSLKGWKTPSEISVGLVSGGMPVSPQHLTNWKTRGVAKQNYGTISRILGCRPLWLEFGDGEMVESATRPAHAEPTPKYVDLPAGIRGERRVPLLTWSDLRDEKKMLNCTTHSGPTAVAPGDNVADNAFAVAYDSDAFLSDIPRSATLIINPGTTWEAGRLALMECSGAIVLRRLALDGERSMLIAHDAANWNATPLNPMSDRIIGLVACAYKNF